MLSKKRYLFFEAKLEGTGGHPEGSIGWGEVGQRSAKKIGRGWPGGSQGRTLAREAKAREHGKQPGQERQGEGKGGENKTPPEPERQRRVREEAPAAADAAETRWGPERAMTR